MRGGIRYRAGRPGWHGKAEHHRQIDARRWAREGLLTAGCYFDWQWSNDDGEKTASIGVQVDSHAQSLTLIYRRRGDGTEKWRDFSFPVRLTRTRCNYGGDRIWFLCPHCGKRAALLYLAANGWFCRQSLRLAYASQSEDYLDRLHRHKSKLEGRLGKRGHGRPKGMHRKTYERLQNDWINAEIAWDDEFGRRAAMMMRWL